LLLKRHGRWKIRSRTLLKASGLSSDIRETKKEATAD
jgi:hypothetical protein